MHYPSLNALHSSVASLLESHLKRRAQVIKVNNTAISNTFNIVLGVAQYFDHDVEEQWSMTHQLCSPINLHMQMTLS